MKSSLFIASLLIILFPYSNKQEVKSGFADVNGTSLYYEVAGNGVPIILVHGNFGDRRHWDFQFSELSKNFKVVRYDVRGYGKSAVPKSDEPYTDRDDLKALMEFLQIEKAHISGVSMGSGIIIDFALNYPDKCLSIIPIGPWAMGYGSGKYRTMYSDSLNVVFAKVSEILKLEGSKSATDYWWAGDHHFAKTTIRSKSTLDSLLRMGYEYSWWGFLNENKRSFTSPPAIRQLNKIKIPTLIVTAEFDLEPCMEIADIMEKEIEGSKKASIEGAGHLMNMDKPKEFNKLISDFINNL